MLTVDDRCSTCERQGKTNIYRMVGKCFNCGTGDILMLFTAGHECYSTQQKCPVCGCRRLHADRLATPDEIPVA